VVITVIAPHARPEFTTNLLDNFRRQRGVEARLVIVANGSAASLRDWPPSDDTTVIWSDAHQSDALNAGLAFLRGHGGGPWARFDDDDYYSPNYLASVAQQLTTHEVVGKTWGFMLLDDGLYRFGGAENGPAEMLTGGSLAARTANVAPFQRLLYDDVEWCRDMRARGVELWAGPHSGYCYDRRSRSAPRLIEVSSLVARWGFGDAEYHGRVPIEFVDAPRAPLRAAPRPTTQELLTEMGAV
jgi:hypothetical protein